MVRLRQFVQDNVRWFRGHAPETEKSLDDAERILGVQLPADIRWLLSTHGYWHATGISSLDETITKTEAAREHLNLPERFVVLYDHQDGGAIILDTDAESQTDENKVYNVAWGSVPDHIHDEIVYDSYVDYVRDVLEQKRDFIAAEDIDYDPTRYRC